MNIDSIKARVSIRDLFDHYGIVVRRRVVLCPLHPDKTPSMSFSEDGLWYCFVCGTGGDIIKLVMLLEKLDFKESLKWLNDKFSLGLTEEKPKRNYYLEALNKNYQILKESLEKEFNDNCKRYYELMDMVRTQHFPYLFWSKEDYTFEHTYQDRQDFIESKLRELENARYRLRRTSSQAV